MPRRSWELQFVPSATLPPMAWLLRARPPVAELTFGRLVRPSGAGIFEGTWVGAGDPLEPLRTTTTFGSGVLLDGDELYLIPPGHMLEGIYLSRLPHGLIASNSLAGLLEAAGLELDPSVAYPPLFDQSVRGVMHTTISTTTQPIETCFHDNLRMDLDGRVTIVPKPREQPFATFEDYRDRVSSVLASAFANAPSFEPIVTISSGYDGAASAVLAREHGCRDMVTVAEGKRVRGNASLADSGEFVGRRLGLDVHEFERLAYRTRTDLPEAEFLATGFTGEEVFMSAMEPVLRGRLLITGFFGSAWWMHRPVRPFFLRTDQSGSSLGEWRLRLGFIHVPLPCFAMERYGDLVRISRSPQMRHWVLGRSSDKPIPRRILEEAGIPRDAFGNEDRAASAEIHTKGPEELAPATRSALEVFAATENRRVTFRRRSLRNWERALIKGARKVGAELLANRLEWRKHRLSIVEPVFGSLLLRWSLSVVRPRYAELAPSDND